MFRIIDFESEDLMSIHFFVENMDFPVVIAAYNEWDEQQILYMKNNISSQSHTVKSISKWCINHQLQFRIILIPKILDIIINPYKYIRIIEIAITNFCKQKKTNISFYIGK